MNDKMTDTDVKIKIKIKYSCLQCSLKNIVLEVPARGDEDVVAWMQNSVGANIKKDHTLRSPECPADSAQEVMIPMTGTDRIGGPTIQ
jgi:hypothetical protein